MHAGRPLRNREFSRISRFKQYLVGRAVSDLAGSSKRKLSEAGLHTPDHFFGINQTGFLDASAVLQILENLPEGTSELMCHPGYRDVDLERTGTRLLSQREIEIQGLTAVSVRNLVVSGGIRLLNYKEYVELTERTSVAA